MLSYILEWIGKRKPLIGEPGKILDVGGRDVNGSPRIMFLGKYTVLDMIDGKGVDIVMNAHDMKFKEEFDLVMCLETFEHDDKFWITLDNCKKALKKGGWMILSAPGPYAPKHDWPGDYYRFQESAFKTFFKGYNKVEVEEIWGENCGTRERPNLIIGMGQKP